MYERPRSLYRKSKILGLSFFTIILLTSCSLVSDREKPYEAYYDVLGDIALGGSQETYKIGLDSSLEVREGRSVLGNEGAGENLRLPPLTIATLTIDFIEKDRDSERIGLEVSVKGKGSSSILEKFPPAELTQIIISALQDSKSVSEDSLSIASKKEYIEVPLNPQRLLRQERNDIIDRLGNPDNVRHESLAEVWSYRRETCTLYIYFHNNKGDRGKMRVNYLDYTLKNQDKKGSISCLWLFSERIQVD